MNPCCGASNQTGVKIIAILKLVISILVLVFGIFMCVGSVGMKEMADEHQHYLLVSGLSPKDLERKQVEANAMMIGSIFVISFGLISLLLSVLLLVGAKKRNRTMCLVYFVATIIVLILSAIGSIWKVSTVGGPAPIIGKVFGLILEGFFLCVVWEFIKELEDSGNGGIHRV